jgi:hypothetical protein
MSEFWRVLLALAIPTVAGGGSYLAIKLVTEVKP